MTMEPTLAARTWAKMREELLRQVCKRHPCSRSRRLEGQHTCLPDFVAKACQVVIVPCWGNAGKDTRVGIATVLDLSTRRGSCSSTTPSATPSTTTTASGATVSAPFYCRCLHFCTPSLDTTYCHWATVTIAVAAWCACIPADTWRMWRWCLVRRGLMSCQCCCLPKPSAFS